MLEIDLYNPRHGARDRSADASLKSDQINNLTARVTPSADPISN